MRNSEATITAVKDGGAPCSSVRDNLPARTGLFWARQKQVYHVVSLAEVILGEASALLGSLAKQAGHGMFGHADTEPLPPGQVSAVLAEILDCIDLAAEHVSMLNVQLRNQIEDEES